MKELGAMAILRNHIIHGGYTPLEKEAKTALDTTSKFMKLSQEEIIVKYPYQKNTEKREESMPFCFIKYNSSLILTSFK